MKKFGTMKNLEFLLKKEITTFSLKTMGYKIKMYYTNKQELMGTQKYFLTQIAFVKMEQLH